MYTYNPEAAVLAYRRLLALNLESWKPEVAQWLHSDAAEPVLSDLLVNVPCSTTLH